jgi:hypothetical protein
MLFLKDVLEEMYKTDVKGKPKPFSIEFVTADTNRMTGGDLIKIEKAVLLQKNDKKILGSTSEAKAKTRKNPNHWQNSTRNILLPNGEKRKLHIRLITKFNKQPVIY